MPELPEVETVRNDLDRLVVGRTVVAPRATGRRTVRRYGEGPAALVAFTADVGGLLFTGTRRHGKYLVVDGTRADGTEAALVIHLRMSGQLIHAVPADPMAPHTHVVLPLDDGCQLRFVDPRTFGEMWLTSPSLPDLEHLGPDALLWAADQRASVAALRGRRTMVKALLMDQGFVAGIGNIYSDEILHRARVRPDRRAMELSLPAAQRVVAITGEVLGAAIALRGSSLSDAQYVDLAGEPGRAAQMHLVYARQDLPCATCGRPVSRIRFGGRSSYFCRRCQR